MDPLPCVALRLTRFWKEGGSKATSRESFFLLSPPLPPLSVFFFGFVLSCSLRNALFIFELRLHDSLFSSAKAKLKFYAVLFAPPFRFFFSSLSDFSSDGKFCLADGAGKKFNRFIQML